MKLFDIRNAIVVLFKKGFIKPLKYQRTVKLELKPEPEESVGEKIKLRKQRLNEIAKNEKKINLELFRKYFKYLRPASMYKTLNQPTNTERNKIQAD